MRRWILPCALLIITVEPARPALSEYSNAELEGYAKLCTRVAGVYCAHCQHRSVEELCPNQCQDCVSGRSLSSPSAFSVDGKSLERLRNQCPFLTGNNCAACLNLDVAQICISDCGLCAGTGQIPFPGFPGFSGFLSGGGVPSNLAISLSNDANTAADPNRVVVSGGIRHGQNLVDLVPKGLNLAEFYYSDGGGEAVSGSDVTLTESYGKQPRIALLTDTGQYESGGEESEYGVDGEVIDEFYAILGDEHGSGTEEYQLVDFDASG